ncbi:MAG: beta-lactamase family protein [Ignavibacteriae bacterium]|nr:beta-lactamase family protein [Ignavibacteriota bacterium]
MLNKYIFPSVILVVIIILLFIFKSTVFNKDRISDSDLVKVELTNEQILKSKEIHKYFSHKNKVNGFNGNVLFAENGNIIYENSFGYADLNSEKKNYIDTKFQIASVSKPFTAYAIMLLKQKNELSLEDSIQQYFPEFPYKGITVKLLLIHKSGLPEYFYFAEKLWEDKKTPITNTDVINLMIEKFPNRYYLPDKKYNYINTNYCILAAIIEKITGDDFEEFMNEEIFQPLEMHNTFIYNPSSFEEFKNTATGYEREKIKAQDTFLNGVVGDKGVYTTVEDLLKFDKALYKGNPVEVEIINEAFQPAHEKLFINDNYGYGWRINAEDSANKIVYHAGWWKGFRSYFIRELGKKKTIIILSNLSNKAKFGTKELIELFN